MADRDRYPIHVRYLGDATPWPVLVRHDGMLRHCDVDAASRLLAGLEVALAAALREAGMGKCLKCGRVEGWLAGLHASGPDVVVHCGQCGGVLAPVKGRQP
jgi:hypothetical protein